MAGFPIIRFGTLAASHAMPSFRRSDIPVIFVHGAWGGKYQFARWMRYAASQGWESYALDLRGHGESPCEDFTGVSVRDYADDIETAVRAIGPSYVAGHSLGGLALQLAASRSRSIRKAVFVASAPPGMLGQSRYGARALGYIGALLSRKPVAIKREDVRRLLFGRSPVAEEFDFTIRESPRAILDKGLGRIKARPLLCPSLVVDAQDDRAIPRSSARSIAQEYGSDYMQVPDMGHMLMLEEGWERPIQEILRWLDAR